MYAVSNTLCWSLCLRQAGSFSSVLILQGILQLQKVSAILVWAAMYGWAGRATVAASEGSLEACNDAGMHSLCSGEVQVCHIPVIGGSGEHALSSLLHVAGVTGPFAVRFCQLFSVNRQGIVLLLW